MVSALVPSSPSRTGTPKPALHLNFLDGIRGLAALYVVLFHFLDLSRVGLSHTERLLAHLSEGGHSAVTVFIVLSGFSLMLPVARTADGRMKGGTVGFLKRRARRIIPPYYAALAVSLLGLALTPQGLAYVHGARDPRWLADWTAPVLISHLLLLHNLSVAWDGKINRALWSVATEWQIYFLLPFVLLPVWRRKGTLALLGVALALGAAPVFLVRAHWHLLPGAVWYVGTFGTGAAGAVWASQGLADAGRGPALRRSALIGLGILAVAYGLSLRYVAPPHTVAADATRSFLNAVLKDYLLGGMVVCVLIFGALSQNIRTSLAFAPFRLLETPVARGLGAFSYSLYLTHCVVLSQADTLIALRHLSLTVGFEWKALLGIPCAVALAYLFHLVFERPFMVSSTSRNLRLLAEAPERPSGAV